MSDWIEFVEPPKPHDPHAKTKRWLVVEKSTRATLGVVRWYGAWRRYAFEPQPSTVWEQDCLRAVAEFIEEKTREHKEAKQAEKST